MENQKNFADEDIAKNHDVAAFSWTLIFAPVLIFLRRDSRFIQFHARQAMVLFLISGIIFSLPSPLSNLNIFSLAAAAIGFLNANLGKWYRAPLIYDLSEKGFSSPREIFAEISQLFLNFGNFIKRFFSRNSAAVQNLRENKIAAANFEQKIKILADENSQLSQKLNFLEIEFVVEKFLRGLTARELSVDSKNKIKIAREIFANEKIIERDEIDFLHFQISNKNVIFGNFSTRGFLVLANFEIESAEINFGNWRGVSILFDEFKNDRQKLENIFKEFFS